MFVIARPQHTFNGTNITLSGDLQVTMPINNYLEFLMLPKIS